MSKVWRKQRVSRNTLKCTWNAHCDPHKLFSLLRYKKNYIYKNSCIIEAPRMGRTHLPSHPRPLQRPYLKVYNFMVRGGQESDQWFSGTGLWCHQLRVKINALKITALKIIGGTSHSGEGIRLRCWTLMCVLHCFQPFGIAFQLYIVHDVCKVSGKSVEVCWQSWRNLSRMNQLVGALYNVVVFSASPTIVGSEISSSKGTLWWSQPFEESARLFVVQAIIIKYKQKYLNYFIFYWVKFPEWPSSMQSYT